MCSAALAIRGSRPLDGAVDERLDAACPDAVEVLAGLEQRPERPLRGPRLDALLAEHVQGLRPVERLADAGDAVEVEPAELLNEAADLADEGLGRLRQPCARDRDLAA